jgi:hypothetical protein
MPRPFIAERYIKWKDIERCSYPIFRDDPNIVEWSRKDDERLLLIALERYAMELIDRFKSGCRVKTVLFQGVTLYGEVTIVTEDKCKVIWDDCDMPYDYWPKKDLEIVSEDEFYKQVYD